MKNSLSIAILFIIGMALILACRGGKQASSPGNSMTKTKPEKSVQAEPSAKTPEPPDSPEYQLAVINAGYAIDKNDASVKRFRFLIQNIQRKTGNTPQQIADMTVNGQKILLDRYGKEVPLIEMMEQANKGIPENANQKYEDIITALVLIMGE